ncbi:MAG: YihY/virulence factor BrkB family protein [Lachnospirales bacterium]
MKKIITFLIVLVKEFNRNELLFIASELTYKLLLAIFPLAICISSMFSLINLDSYDLTFLEGLNGNAIPAEASNTLNSIATSINYSEPNALNAIIYSLIFAIFSASSGFLSLIRGINKSFGIKDDRNFITRRLLSVCLLVVFLLSLIITLVLYIFGDIIINFIISLDLFPTGIFEIYPLVSLIFTTSFVLVNIIIIFKFSSYKKIRFKNVLPGAFITLIFWILSSQLFNVYVNNFSRYNSLYGSIGNYLIFVLWINLLAIVLLIGSQTNAILLEKKFS